MALNNIKIDFDGLTTWLAVALFLLILNTGEKELAKHPHGLAAAVLCRIGGPNFCPAPLNIAAIAKATSPSASIGGS